MKLSDLPQFDSLIQGDRVLIVRADGVVGTADKSLLGSGGGGETPPEPTLQPFQFLLIDSIAQGNWGGKYGSKGYVLFGWNGGSDVANAPLNSTGYTKDASLYGYAISDIRALPGLPDNSGDRRALVLYGATPSVSFAITDSVVGKVTVYTCDFDNNRNTITARIESLTDSTNFVEKTLTAEEYNLGSYCQFTYSGSFKISMSNPANANNTLSAIFFD